MAHTTRNIDLDKNSIASRLKRVEAELKSLKGTVDELKNVATTIQTVSGSVLSESNKP